MIKLFSRFFFVVALLLGSTPLCAAPNWQRSKQTLHRNGFEFVLPTPLEATKKSHIHYWKAEADGNSYWVAAKQRQCNQGQAPIKICDVTPILHSIVQTPVMVDQKKDSRGYLHFVLKEGSFFYYTAVCFNDNIVVVLMTKTPQQQSADHERFIESFRFLN